MDSFLHFHSLCIENNARAVAWYCGYAEMVGSADRRHHIGYTTGTA